VVLCYAGNGRRVRGGVGRCGFDGQHGNLACASTRLPAGCGGLVQAGAPYAGAGARRGIMRRRAGRFHRSAQATAAETAAA
jgi:hypothetical protein